jgi:hypothetical protein
VAPSRAWVLALALALGGLADGAAGAGLTVQSGGQEVFDARTGLVWRRCAEGQVAVDGRCQGLDRRFTLDQIYRHVRSEAQASGLAWRLPTADELAGISGRVDVVYRPIDPQAFPNTPAALFWIAEFDATVVWALDPYTGQRKVMSAQRELAVRLVRNAPQSPAESAAARSPSR